MNNSARSVIRVFLSQPPYAKRNDAQFLRLANNLTSLHRKGCPQFIRIWPPAKAAKNIEELPFLHAEVFKHLQLKTCARGIKHERVLKSSTTGSGTPSRILLDNYSSALQRKSAELILRDFIGTKRRPLFILDNARSFTQEKEISARTMAAMSLEPFSSEIIFLLGEANDPLSINWDELLYAAGEKTSIIYGPTWMFWQAWGSLQAWARAGLKQKQIYFVHSGGWKKLEEKKVSRSRFDSRLLSVSGPGSKVIDFYGLAEQVGIIFPLCPGQSRHLPAWAEVIVRDPYSLKALPVGEAGQLQFINVLAHGAPYHSVLTEDLGKLIKGPCACGRKGKRFQLLGRIPQAILRGCANV